MRTLFFRAMALVLGLCIITGSFAAGLKSLIAPLVGETWYYDYDGDQPDPMIGWDEEDNWTTAPASQSCPGDEETVCRINLQPNEDLTTFLQSRTSYTNLFTHGQVDKKELP